MKSFRVGPKSSDWYLYKKKEEEIWTQTHKEGHVKMEADIRVRLPQAEEHLEPPGAGRGAEGLSSRDFGGNRALLTP